MLPKSEIKECLDFYCNKYNRADFIETDPIQVPHMFSKPEDIEIAGFLTAILSWGQRRTIISKSIELMRIMDFQPHAFIMGGDEADMERVTTFCHRTFNGTDAAYFLSSMRNIYKHHGGLSAVFRKAYRTCPEPREVLQHFRQVFFEVPYPKRTLKHIPDVSGNAAAKRLNMFLRWMVRHDNRGVDLGLWSDIGAGRLMIPLDVHTGNVARKIGLLARRQNDWQAVCELTSVLRTFDCDDPVKYDFALFGLGVFEHFPK